MRGGGFHDRSRNPNSYPMTSASKFPSAVTVRVNGHVAGRWRSPTIQPIHAASSAGTRSRVTAGCTRPAHTGSSFACHCPRTPSLRQRRPAR